MDKSEWKRNYAGNRSWREYLSTGVEVEIIVALVTIATKLDMQENIFIKIE